MQMYGVLFSGDSHASKANIPWFLKRYRIHSCALSDQHSPVFLSIFLNDNNSNFANDNILHEITVLFD